IKVPQAHQPTIPANAVGVHAFFKSGVVLLALTAVPDPKNHSRVDLSLYWQSGEQRAPIDATIFVHIADKSGKIVAQQDERPWNGQYPPFIWDKGEVIQTTSSLDTGGAAPADLNLELGMYTFPGAVRVPVTQDGNTLQNSVVRFDRLDS